MELDGEWSSILYGFYSIWLFVERSRQDNKLVSMRTWGLEMCMLSCLCLPNGEKAHPAY